MKLIRNMKDQQVLGNFLEWLENIKKLSGCNRGD